MSASEQIEALETQLDHTYLELQRAEDSLDFYRKMVDDLGNRVSTLHREADQAKSECQGLAAKHKRVIASVRNKMGIVKSLLEGLEEELYFLEE